MAQLRRRPADPARPTAGGDGLQHRREGKGFEYIFGRGKGLVSIRYNGVQLLDDTVRPNFWRAPTNNDEGCAEPFTFAFWKTAGLYARCDNLTAKTKGEFVTVRANYTLPNGQTLPIDFAIDSAGRCDITMTWQGEHTELPEFGLLFPLRRELTEVSYLGLGPRETTADRTAGGKMGAWSYNVRQDLPRTPPSTRRSAAAAPACTAQRSPAAD